MSLGLGVITGAADDDPSGIAQSALFRGGFRTLDFVGNRSASPRQIANVIKYPGRRFG
jgi:hypothetical protein